MTFKSFAGRPWPVFAAFVALLLPWMEGGTTALSLNFRDLAEWCSLNPLSRNSDLALGASLGLRLLPALLLAMWLLQARPGPLPRALVTILLAVSLLPPPEFFAGDLRDPNYRQMTLVALITLLAGLVCGLRPVTGTRARATLAVFSILTAWHALSAALDLQRSLELEVSPGIGFPTFVLATLVYLIQTAGTTHVGRPGFNR